MYDLPCAGTSCLSRPGTGDPPRDPPLHRPGQAHRPHPRPLGLGTDEWVELEKQTETFFLTTLKRLRIF